MSFNRFFFANTRQQPKINPLKGAAQRPHSRPPAPFRPLPSQVAPPTLACRLAYTHSAAAAQRALFSRLDRVKRSAHKTKIKAIKNTEEKSLKKKSTINSALGSTVSALCPLTLCNTVALQSKRRQVALCS